MAEYTDNLQLYKPNRADAIEVDTSLSENMTKIDTKFGEVDTKITELESRPAGETGDIDGGSFLDTYDTATSLDGGEF